MKLNKDFHITNQFPYTTPQNKVSKQTMAIQKMKNTKPTYNEKLGKVMWGNFSK